MPKQVKPSEKPAQATFDKKKFAKEFAIALTLFLLGYWTFY